MVDEYSRVGREEGMTTEKEEKGDENVKRKKRRR